MFDSYETEAATWATTQQADPLAQLGITIGGFFLGRAIGRAIRRRWLLWREQ